MSYQLLKGQELLCYKCDPNHQKKENLVVIRGTHVRGTPPDHYRVKLWYCKDCKLSIEQKVQ